MKHTDEACQARSSIDLTPIQQWVGTTELSHDVILETPVQALNCLLDSSASALLNKAVVPPLWHWIHFHPVLRQSDIGPDGHPKRGGFLPPIPLPRRMWAGSQLNWEIDNPLRIGDQIRRESTLESVTHKVGRSGDLVFVTVKHLVFNDHGLSITEEQNIVYRDVAPPDEPPPSGIRAKQEAQWSRQITPDPVLLFSYSALTLNRHRIHYDRNYATGVEGYPGLVVHGPLIATLLLDLLRQAQPHKVVTRFQFRAVRPTYDLHAFDIKGDMSHANASSQNGGDTVELWALDHDGFLTMQATATIR